MSPVSGIAAIAKPAGVTSFASLHPLKRGLGTAKVGHTGTLDRFATGLLIVLVGGYSRLSGHFMGLDKTYRALVRLGAETDTLDPEGRVVAEAPPPSREALEAVLDRFRGPILQAPPAFSALHLDGKRAYERALKGEVLEMKPRPVTIHRLELLDVDGSTALLDVACSSGTYIRSLARDLALAAGSRASLLELQRTSIGPFRLEDALAPEALGPEGLRALDPGLALALGLRPRLLPARLVERFLHGGLITPSELGELPGTVSVPGTADGSEAPRTGDSAIFGPEGVFLGVADESGGAALRYRFVCGATP